MKSDQVASAANFLMLFCSAIGSEPEEVLRCLNGVELSDEECSQIQVALKGEDDV